MNHLTTLITLSLTILLYSQPASAQVSNTIAAPLFTPQEQQSISVETPGLFDRSNAFTVDFGQIRNNDYSFPLPVGKAEGLRPNNNITITSTKGDAVKSMFSGTVRLSREIKPWGNVVVVRHDNGLETVYGNNAQNLVKVGDRVKAGQTIAIIGSNDNKTYCEFAIMINGARINPETLLDIGSHRLRSQTLLFTKMAQGVKIKVVAEEKQQLVKNVSTRKQPLRGNMNTNQNRQVKESNSASNKYTKDSEHIVQRLDDSSDMFLDIDEFQAIKLEPDNVKDPFGGGNDFSINFAQYKDTEWAYPMKGAHVISPFGGKRRHAGTDIKTRPGDEIYAAFEGKVTLSGTHYGYGLCIVIRHSNGLETLYSHQSKNLVKVGDWVKAGQVIGIVGRSGRATTEHCHFEVRCNGRPFDSSKLYDHAKNQIRRETFVFRKAGKGITITKK